MKTIKSYNTFLSENKNSNYYILFDDVVHVDNISRWGDEIKVEYTKEDGTQHTYIGDDKDFREDFLETTKTFNFKEPVKAAIIHTSIPKSQIKEEDKYNIVFYIGKTKMENIRTNINSKLAYALKNTYNKDPKYKLGRIEVEKI